VGFSPTVFSNLGEKACAGKQDVKSRNRDIRQKPQHGVGEKGRRRRPQNSQGVRMLAEALQQSACLPGETPA